MRAAAAAIMSKNWLRDPSLLTRQTPSLHGDVADGMEGESQKVQRHEHGGKILLAVPEVVFEIVAVVLQDVEAFVLDLPAGPATGGQFGHRVGADGQVGDEAVAVGDGAGGVDDLDHQPVDGQGVGVAAQRDVGEPAVAVSKRSRPRLTLRLRVGSSTPVRYSSIV